MGCGSSSSTDTTKDQKSTTASPRTEPAQQSNNSNSTTTKRESNANPSQIQETSNDSNSSFIEDAIKAHNDFRDKHGTPHVTHAPDLSTYAQKWAEHLAKTGQFEHSDCNHKGESIGENLAMMGGSGLSDKRAADYIQMWYDEIKDYKYFGQNPDMNQFGKYGHFTQLVWKGAKEVGVGIATGDGQCVVVCNYRPAGNMIGDFIDNVPPPL